MQSKSPAPVLSTSVFVVRRTNFGQPFNGLRQVFASTRTESKSRPGVFLGASPSFKQPLAIRAFIFNSRLPEGGAAQGATRYSRLQPMLRNPELLIASLALFSIKSARALTVIVFGAYFNLHAPSVTQLTSRCERAVLPTIPRPLFDRAGPPRPARKVNIRVANVGRQVARRHQNLRVGPPSRDAAVAAPTRSRIAPAVEAVA